MSRPRKQSLSTHFAIPSSLQKAVDHIAKQYPSPSGASIPIAESSTHSLADEYMDTPSPRGSRMRRPGGARGGEARGRGMEVAREESEDSEPESAPKDAADAIPTSIRKDTMGRVMTPPPIPDRSLASIWSAHITALATPNILASTRLPQIRWEKHGLLTLQQKRMLADSIARQERELGECEVEITKLGSVRSEMEVEVRKWRGKRKGLNKVLKELFGLYAELNARRTGYYEHAVAGTASGLLGHAAGSHAVLGHGEGGGGLKRSSMHLGGPAAGMLSVGDPHGGFKRSAMHLGAAGSSLARSGGGEHGGSKRGLNVPGGGLVGTGTKKVSSYDLHSSNEGPSSLGVPTPAGFNAQKSTQNLKAGMLHPGLHVPSGNPGAIWRPSRMNAPARPSNLSRFSPGD